MISPLLVLLEKGHFLSPRNCFWNSLLFPFYGCLLHCQRVLCLQTYLFLSPTSTVSFTNKTFSYPSTYRGSGHCNAESTGEWFQLLWAEALSLTLVRGVLKCEWALHVHHHFRKSLGGFNHHLEQQNYILLLSFYMVSSAYHSRSHSYNCTIIWASQRKHYANQEKNNKRRNVSKE